MTKSAKAARRRYRANRTKYKRKPKVVRRVRRRKRVDRKRLRRRAPTFKRKRVHYAKRRPGLSYKTRQRLTAEQVQRDAEYKKFDTARTAIAKRLGVSPGHANAHYQALIEYHGMSPEKAEEATWGFQP